MFNPKKIIKLTKTKNKTIVFPEADFSERIVEAGKFVNKSKIAKVIFIGDESSLILKHKDLHGITIINPKTSALTAEIADIIFEKRKEKGLSLKKAKELATNPIYFATMLVEMGIADGMVCGAETSTSDTLRPALQLIRAEENGLVCSCNIMYGKHKLLDKSQTLVIGDCGLNVSPTAEELAEITRNIDVFAKNVCQISPRIALLSFSTKGSAVTTETKKVALATKLVKEKYPKIVCDGELQLDSAMIDRVAKIKCPDSPVAGKANVLIFPELQSGNICYKTIERFGGLQAFGPITLGLKKPVNDLSRGCNINDIIIVTAITVLQCK